MHIESLIRRRHRYVQEEVRPLDISLGNLGAFYAVWLGLAIPTIVYLAGRKTDTRQLTILWGVIAALVPPFGLLFILAMLIKNDRTGA